MCLPFENRKSRVECSILIKNVRPAGWLAGWLAEQVQNESLICVTCNYLCELIVLNGRLHFQTICQFATAKLSSMRFDLNSAQIYRMKSHNLN